MVPPEDIQLVGDEIAIRWSDGVEQFISSETLRAGSPSAENQGEPDILGRIHGGQPGRKFPGVTVVDWEFVGNYAVRFRFSDNHSSGIYSYRYLRDRFA